MNKLTKRNYRRHLTYSDKDFNFNKFTQVSPEILNFVYYVPFFKSMWVRLYKLKSYTNNY